MSSSKKRILQTLIVVATTALLIPVDASAATFSVTPLVIDGKGKPREIMHHTIVLENTGSSLASIYPWVTNYTSASGTEVMPDLTNADLSTSLANWIEVTRGVVDLMPGERREVPVMIQINQSAKPGTYHAEIHFAHGSNRREAEASTAGIVVPVNIDVLDDANERLQLDSFAPTKNWFTGEKASFALKLENIGNRGVVPKGKVRIYDRRGAEIAAIDANQNGERLEPSGEALMAAVWQANGEFGRYKAFLDIEYGEGGRGTLQDTVFFWVIPWQKVLGLFLSITIASVIVAVLMHTRTQADPAYALSRARREEERLESKLRERANTLAYAAYPDTQVVTEKASLVERLWRRVRHTPDTLDVDGGTGDDALLRDTQIFDSVQLEDVQQKSWQRPEVVRIEPRPKFAAPPSPDHIVNLKG